MRLHTESCMCERTYIWMCGDNDVKTIKIMQMNCLKPLGTEVKNKLFVSVCVIICECVGWERVLFSKS